MTVTGPASTAEEPTALAVMAAGDRDAFGALVEPHRPELRVHCYRILGSLDEAEDQVQETFLRAWRRRETYEGRSGVRAWLYKIATNGCLEVLRSQRRVPVEATGDGRTPPASSYPWVQPFPDALLDVPAPAGDEPEAVAVSHEAIALAFLVAVQILPPRQRAVLVLRDVLAFSAAETAALMDCSVAAANSALQRARATLSGHQGSIDAGPRPVAAGSPQEKAMVERYIRAHEQADPAAIVAVLREDARLTISLNGLAWEGRDEVAGPFLDGMSALGQWRCLPARANGQPAVANYLRPWGDAGPYRAFTIVLLDVRGDELVEMATFAAPHLFLVFGLPSVLA